MKFHPHAYQTRAVEFVKSHPHCALFLDMGLGKTVSALTAVNDLIDDADVRRVLVVAPKKVAESTWSTECDKWDHLRHLRVSKVIGTEKRRRDAISEEADIYVVGRDNVVWLFENALGLTRKLHPFDMIIVDELTSFKSHVAKRTKALCKWTSVCPRVVGLTGTPVPNSYMDLFAEIKTIDGGQRFGRFIGKFREKYFNAVPIGNFTTKYELKRGAGKEMLERISDICLTMRAKDNLELPSMSEVTVDVCLPDKVMEKYKEFEKEQVLLVKGQAIVADNAAGLLNKLGQFANGAVYGSDGEWTSVHDEKVEHLREIVEQAQSPVLVFYQYRHDKERILSSVSGAVEYEGESQLNAWNEGRIPVLLAHPASCAYGLNMQRGGHYIVWFGTGWNLEQYQQANARLHRQGQTHPVTVYRLICKGTVDVLAASAIDRKCGTQEAVIETLKGLLKKYDV